METESNMVNRESLLDDLDRLENFVSTKHQASSTLLTSPLVSSRKRAAKPDRKSSVEMLRTMAPADAIEHQPQRPAFDLEPASSRQRSANTYVSSVAKKVRFPPSTKTTNGAQAAKDYVIEPLPTSGLGDRSARLARLTHLARDETRIGRYLRLLACQDSPEAHWTELNVAFSEGHLSLALAFNDLAESIRLDVLRTLSASARSELLEYISEIQMNKDRFDPKSLFPCVATKKFMDTLPLSARSCSICGDGLQDGYDVIWKGCGKHTFHFKCFKDSIGQDQRPLCDCL